MTNEETRIGLNLHEVAVFTGNVDDVALMPFGQDGAIFIASPRINLPVNYTSNLTAAFAHSNEPVNQSRHEIFEAVQSAIAGIPPETSEETFLTTLREICDQTFEGFDERRNNVYFNTAFHQFEKDMVIGIIANGQLFLLARNEWGTGDSTTYHMTAGIIRDGKLITMDKGIPLDQEIGDYRGARVRLAKGDLVCSANSYGCNTTITKDKEIKDVQSAVATMQKSYQSFVREDFETPSILCVGVTEVSADVGKPT